MAARPKVYQASFGFRESVVAAPNQKAALEAWGARQNLFAEGLARVADDPTAVEAALAHPGQPLSRPVGSTGAFALEDRELPKVPAARKSAGPRPKVAANERSRALQPARRPPDRSPLDAAEATLARLQADRRAAEDDFHDRRRALEKERAAAVNDLDGQLAAARATEAAARRAYRDAGGEK
jgi:hypothetical protein